MAKSSKQYVVVRTYSAGVHVGELVERNGQEVVLANARRVWSWQGRNTLHEIANHGVGKGSRVSEAVTAVTLTQVIEVLVGTDECRKNFEEASWG